jgi:HEAT repeat protein
MALPGPVTVALALGTVMSLFLAVLLAATLGYAGVRSRREERADRRRPAVRESLLATLADNDPDWTAWAEGLSPLERRIAEDLIQSYLRTLQGREHRVLRNAAETLGIPGRERRTVRSTDASRYAKLRALSWLTLLDCPVPPETLQAACRGDRDLEAAGARLLHVTGTPEARSAGTELLLGRGERLTAFGIDTLYRLHRSDPTFLFEYAAAHSDTWESPLLVQVLRAVSHYNVLDESAPAGWLLGALDHPTPTVRAVAVAALQQYGWRSDVRDAVDLDSLAGDPDPAVRRALCRTLTVWGDPEAVATLQRVFESDPVPRVKLAALHGLARTDGEPPPNVVADDVWWWITRKAEARGGSV